MSSMSTARARKRRRPTERRLVDVLVRHFRESNPARREVVHYEKRIDLAVVDSKSSEVWAIEAKSTNWIRAFSQAVVNLAAADRSYIAIYNLYAHRVKKDLIGAYGIGLIAVGTRWGDVELLVEAGVSPYTNRLAAERIREQIGEN